MRYMDLFAAVLVVLAMATGGFAADDPSIKGRMRAGIEAAMTAHISHNTVAERYVIYDAVTGDLRRLRFDKLHKGIIKKGDFYVSCADFVDAQGKKFDIDFLVVQEEGSYRVLESVVHSAGGKKRKYHLED